jgi:hypothetical protein
LVGPGLIPVALVVGGFVGVGSGVWRYQQLESRDVADPD